MASESNSDAISVSRNQSTDPRQMMASSRMLVSDPESHSLEHFRIERGRVPSARVFSMVCGCSILLVIVLLVVIGLGPF